MVDEQKKHDMEAEELKREINEFMKEKERVRAIVGRIGGVPNFTKKLYNILFVIAVVGFLVASLISEGQLRLLMIELAIATISFKLLYLINNHAKMNHFNLWMLTSIEWRINEIINIVRENKK